MTTPSLRGYTKAYLYKSFLTLTKPTGTASGDWLVAIVAQRDAGTISPPDGTWTQLTPANPCALYKEGIWYKQAGGAEPASYTFTSTTARGFDGILVAIQDSAGLSAWSAAYAASGTTVTCPAVTVPGPNSFKLRAISWHSLSFVSYPSGPTAIDNTSSLKGTYEPGVAATWIIQAASGSSGTADFEVSSNSESQAWTITFSESTGLQQITVDGIPSVDAFGTPTVQAGAVAQSISADGFANTTSFGSPVVTGSNPPPSLRSYSIAFRYGNYVTVSKPAGVVDGDLMIAVAAQRDVNTPTPPAGWTKLNPSTPTSAYSEGIWYKVASSEGASYTWTTDTGYRGYSIIICAIKDTAGIDVSGSNFEASGTAPTAPSVNATVGNTIRLRTCTWGAGGFTAYPETGIDNSAALKDASSPGVAAAWAAQPAVGATGAVDFTTASSSSNESWTLTFLQSGAPIAQTVAPVGKASSLAFGTPSVLNVGQVSFNGIASTLAFGIPIVGDFSVYYVDFTGGSDSNSGKSTAAAWKTISKVNSAALQPGDYVLFKRGEKWWDSQLTPPVSGTSADWITFGAYGSGDRPLISGGVNGAAATWTNVSGSIWRTQVGHSSGYDKKKNQIYPSATITAYDDAGGRIPSGIEVGVQGLDGVAWTNSGTNQWSHQVQNIYGWSYNQLITNGTVRGGPQSSLANVNAEGKWYLSGTTLTIYSTSNPDTAYSSIVVAELNSQGDWVFAHNGSVGYYIMYSASAPSSYYSYLGLPNQQYCVNHAYARNYIEYQDIDFKHGCEGVIIGSSAHHVTLTRCGVMQNCRNGISVSTANNVTVDGCWLLRNGTEWFKASNNTAPERNGHGIIPSGASNGLWIIDTESAYNAEDSLQHDPSMTGDVVTVDSCYFHHNREDDCDIKGGRLIVQNGTVLGPTGDGVGRNNILMHDNSVWVKVYDSFLQVGVGEAGDCVSLINGPGLVYAEVYRSILDASLAPGLCINSDNGQTDYVYVESSWLLGGSNNPCIDMNSGDLTAIHCSFRKNGGANVIREVFGGGTHKLYNCVIQNSNVLVNFTAGASLEMKNCCLYRSDSASAWVTKGSTSYSETQMDSSINTGGLNSSGHKTSNPQYTSSTDLTIPVGSPAASGGLIGTGVTQDINGSTFNAADPAIGATTSQTQQSVTAVGIASTIAFGTLKINRYILATGIASTSAVGTPSVTGGILTINVNGKASSVAFGTLKVNLQVLPTGIASAAAMGSPRVKLQGEVPVDGIASTLGFGNLTIIQELMSSVDGIASTLSVGEPRILQERVIDQTTIYTDIGGEAQTPVVGETQWE